MPGSTGTGPPTGPSRDRPKDSRSGSSTPSRSALGRRGEALAAGFFAARGYQIVARNVRADRVELDLIVRRGELLVFVEVKTRRDARHAEAAEAVDPRKQRRLRRGARAWLAAHPPAAAGARRHRFDVVTCIRLASSGEAPAENATSAPDGTRWSIEHWESAF